MQKHTLKDNLLTVLLGITLFLIVVSLMAVFGGLTMKLFGFKYYSFWGLILYFIIVAVVSLPFDLVIMAVPKAMMDAGRISKTGAMVSQFILDTGFSFGAFYVVDIFMESVDATIVSIIVVSMIFAMFGVVELANMSKNK